MMGEKYTDFDGLHVIGTLQLISMKKMTFASFFKKTMF